MNLALIFKNELGEFMVEQKQIICFNGLHTLEPTHYGASYYDANHLHVSRLQNSQFKLFGMGWWRYAQEYEDSIPGMSLDHIDSKARPTNKERELRNFLTSLRVGGSAFSKALRHPACYAFVTSDWPISCAVAYLQGYRNTSNRISGMPHMRELFSRVCYYHLKSLKSWVPVWDLICNDGSDSTILSFAGNAAIRKIAKEGYYVNRKLFKNGDAKMETTNCYRKGDQTQHVINNVGAPLDNRWYNEGDKNKMFIIKLHNMQRSIASSHPNMLLDGLQQSVPNLSVFELAQQIYGE